MASLAQVEEDAEDDDDGDDDEVAADKLETKPLSTTFLASTPASLFSTPEATDTVMYGAVSFLDVLGSKAKTSEDLISASSTTMVCALPSSATPVARSLGAAGEPRRGANFAIVSASGLNASVRWSAETFAWEGGALREWKRERKVFFPKRLRRGKKKLATPHTSSSFFSPTPSLTHRQRSSSREFTSRKMAAYLTVSLGGRRKAGSFLRVRWRRPAAAALAAASAEEEAVNAVGGGVDSSDARFISSNQTRSFSTAETASSPLLSSMWGYKKSGRRRKDRAAVTEAARGRVD